LARDPVESAELQPSRRLAAWPSRKGAVGYPLTVRRAILER
jgi:hypothetical protein